MADVKISALPVATTPLDGTELVPIVQSGVTERVTVANLTAGRSVAASELVVSASSADTLVRITQTGTGNALVVEDSANPDATPFVVDANGRVIAGNTAIAAIGADTPSVQTFAGSSTNNGFGNFHYGASTGSSNFDFAKSRSTTFGAFSVVSSGDSLGKVKFFGDDGSAFIEAARVEAAVDGTPGTNDMPGRLVFSTTADGAAAPSERMRIDSQGRVGIGTASLGPQRMRVEYTISDATASSINIQANGTHTLTADNAFFYTGFSGGAALNQGGFNATVALPSGGSLQSYRTLTQVTGASGTVTAAVGVLADVRNTGAGTLTNGVGFHAGAVQNSGGGTLTNAMGFYAATQTAGTNNFGFYSNVASGTGRWNFYANGTADNYFAGNVGVGTTTPLNRLDVVGSFGRGAPVTKTGNFTLATTENWIICNGAGSITATLPAASSWTGREVMIKTIAAQTVVSASSNVVPLAGGAAGTAILPATAGSWATLVSDGTNWIIMQA